MTGQDPKPLTENPMGWKEVAMSEQDDSAGQWQDSNPTGWTYRRKDGVITIATANYLNALEAQLRATQESYEGISSLLTDAETREQMALAQLRAAQEDSRAWREKAMGFDDVLAALRAAEQERDNYHRLLNAAVQRRSEEVEQRKRAEVAEQERDDAKALWNHTEERWRDLSQAYEEQRVHVERLGQVIGTLLEALEQIGKGGSRGFRESVIFRYEAIAQAALATARAAGYGTPVADAILAAQEEGPGGANRLGAD